MGLLKKIGSFGDVAAEQDAAMLSYFLKTEAVDRVESGTRLMVLGRKGSGKTALAKYFSTGRSDYISESLSLRDYPWNQHKSKVNVGASDIEAYVSSWRYLIALKANSLLIKAAGSKIIFDSQRAAYSFLHDNYGNAEPSLADILRPQRLKFTKAALRPIIMGNSLEEMNFEAANGTISPDIDHLTKALIDNALVMCSQMGKTKIFLHFDELDQGLDDFDIPRQRMLVGLVLAARSVQGVTFNDHKIVPVIYLRTDLWDSLQFSDKNKISQSSSVHLEWNPDTLKELIERRIQIKIGDSYSWNSVEDGALMRGSQEKWKHVVARTFLRPRDVIQFLNYSIEYALKANIDADRFENADIIGARESYSKYLKQELDDEIVPHWSKWSDTIQAFSHIATINFTRDEFDQAWKKRKVSLSTDADAALEILYRFSVIGYRRGIGKGGSGWTFQYTDQSAGWDNAATKLKVHPGLKEFAKLREGRN